MVYVDPYHVPGQEHDADLVIITHSHHDHYSPEDIRKVMKEDTVFASTEEVGALLRQDFGLDPDYFTCLHTGGPSLWFECGAMEMCIRDSNSTGISDEATALLGVSRKFSDYTMASLGYQLSLIHITTTPAPPVWT